MQVPCVSHTISVAYMACFTFCLVLPNYLYMFYLSIRVVVFLRILFILFHSILYVRPLIDIYWIRKWMLLSKISSPCMHWLVHPKNDWLEPITLLSRVISISQYFGVVHEVHKCLFTYNFTTSSFKKISYLARFHTTQEAVGKPSFYFQWYTNLIWRWSGSKVCVNWL